MSIEVYVPETFRIVHSTSVDFSHRRIVKPINLVQYDSLIPTIAVSLYLKGEPYQIPVLEGINMKVRWGKKDRSYVYKDILGCNSDRTVIYFGIDDQMSSEYGDYDPILELIVPIGEIPNKVGSSSFPVIFDRNPIQI